MHRLYSMRLLPWLAVVLGVVCVSCASIGRPEGGPRDEEPPVFVSSNPAPGAVNVRPLRMNVNFNENIQLEDAFTKVVVSPPSKSTPVVRAGGHRLTVEFRDSLLDSTTYTIDFADAIKDLNEGNILDGFALEFSTGPAIDTLRISGMVLDSRTLEPQQGVLVGVHSNLDDSALTKLPFARIARTNQLGQFTVRGLAPGSYRVFAVNDLNRDYKWDRSEEMAYFDTVISPSVASIAVSDTLYASDGSDSIISRGGIEYLPNDILLSFFSEGYSPQYIKDYTRPSRRQAMINFAAGADSLAEVTVVDGVRDSSLRGRPWREWALMSPNATLDSLKFWITDTSVMAADSLRLAVRYQKTDSTDNLVWTTDTLRFFYRDPDARNKKKKDEEADTVPPARDLLDIRPLIPGAQDVYRPFTFELSQPALTLDSAGVRLEILRDTVWTPVLYGNSAMPDSLQPLLRRTFSPKWEPGGKYRLVADSAAVMGVYGEYNKPVKSEFSVRNLDEYSNLLFRIDGLDGRAAVVELLSSQDAPVYVAPVAAGTDVADFRYLSPGTYYARLYIDSNGNGKYDAGNYAEGSQPEETFYFSKKLELKKNWDVDQDWNLYELAVDLQKPWAIKKNKPKLKRGEKEPGQDEEYEEDGTYDPFGSSSGSRQNNNNRRSSSGNSGNRRTGIGGIRTATER